VSLEPCWLTHQTGAIIRFRPSQLPRLPADDMDLSVELFDGRVVAGRYHRSSANPYVAGSEVRRFILERVAPRSREQALINVAGAHWRLFEAGPVADQVHQYGVSRRRAERGQITGRDLSRILNRIDGISPRSDRTQAYDRLFRPAGLRQLIIQLMGSSCQVEGCDAAEQAAEEWGDPAAGLAIVEVHHIEALAKVADHSPRNLCVVCANHHRLIHGFGPWSVHHEGDGVVLTKAGGRIFIRRNLSFLT
jgi:hypothetical protein